MINSSGSPDENMKKFETGPGPRNLENSARSYRGVSTSICRNKSRGTKSRGAICFLRADNSRNFYQCHVVQVSCPVPEKKVQTIRN